MLDNPSSTPARSPRRRRIASVSLVTGLVAGVVAVTGLAAASPAFAVTPLSLAATVGAETLHDITTEARAALGDARSTLADAGAVEADIAAAGLDLGTESTSVDTVPLLDATAQLSSLDVLPLLLLPGAAEEAATQTDIVDARVADLRERLDVALEKKAAEEAAAKAKREAEAAAAAAAKAAAEANTVDGAKATARRLASANYGWGADQFSCLESLWTKESGWNYQAYNAGSGATGIPQSLPGSKMASAGADWQTNATTQITWGLQYIASAYGSPCSAWGHSQATDWY
ncbi:phospholipase [Microbacterium sulfonylureivorans]|uniref:aggregation-promoting factor C-terminal-like domain-containing protein n=1 Tax=Microbacterium sulfonylureivorans TaxID=2486854 RepID=UPI00197BBCBB|nr:phospholipase [Microbacterium sulfonylureivorans]